MKIVWRKFGIEKTQTAYRNPEGNAPVERFMRYLNQSLTIMLPKYNQWPHILPMILFAYRVLPHSTTLYSPFFLQYGRDPLLPVNSTLLQPVDLEVSSEPCVQYADQLISVMQNVFATVRRRQDLVSRKNAEVKDAKRHSVEYQNGDPVWYFDPQSVLGLTSETRPERLGRELERAVPHKWQYAWSGPHRIAGRINDKVYRIWHDFRKKHISVTVRDLKPYHPFIPLTLPDPILHRKFRIPRIPRVRSAPAVSDETSSAVPGVSAAAPSSIVGPVLPEPFPFLGPEDHLRLRLNDLCVVRLREDLYQPIGVMRFLSRDKNQLVMQYLGCIKLDYRSDVFVKQLFQNSWYQPTTRQIYYKMVKLHRSHVPVTNMFTNQEILISDLIAFPFGLQVNYALPSVVRKVILYHHHRIAAVAKNAPSI
jgi:hypothetical protein